MKNKYLNFAWELWNMKVKIIPIMIGAFGTVTKCWRTSGDHPNYIIIENGQNSEKKSQKFEETCCHSNSSVRPSGNADVKKKIIMGNFKREPEFLPAQNYAIRINHITSRIGSGPLYPSWGICSSLLFNVKDRFKAELLPAVAGPPTGVCGVCDVIEKHCITLDSRV